MTYRQAVNRVFWWEFRRFLKVRELISTVVIILVLGIGIPTVMRVVGGETQRDLAVVGATIDLEDSESFAFSQMTEAEAMAALDDGEVDGVLRLDGSGPVELVVERGRNWNAALQTYLTQAFLPSRLESAGVSAQQLVEITQPLEFQVITTNEENGGGGSLLVSIFLGLMIFGIFTGTGMLFTAITGEKTQRVTELVVSAVPPQAWIDGKVLGTIGYVLVYLVTLAFGIVLSVLGSALLAREPLPALPQFGVDPLVVLAMLVSVALGSVLYLFLFAAIAASIDDPATSQRSGIIMLPGMFIALGFLGLIGDPSNPLFAFLSYFPLTSSSAMSVRIILGDAGLLEALVALVILLISCFGARWAAGKVFSVAVLITGKEPTWGEMIRWLRRAS